MAGGLTVTDGIRLMGRGQPLRVPHDGSAATFAAVHTGQHTIVASTELVKLLMESGQIHKLTEFGEPPIGQRKKGEGWRSGWSELGLDGDHADYYVLTQ